MNKNSIKIKLGIFAFTLFSITLIGLFWLATTPEQTVGLALSYAAGLSMIFLPCTLPLVFIIVPLSMGKDYKKGFLMSILFGLGLTLTLTFYGISVAIIGKWLGMDQITRTMFAVAGSAAYLFGLSQLKLVKFTLPEIGGIPSFIISPSKSEYLKAFFMGLFLGNAGVGCPNPAFYVLLVFIASTGNIVYGGWLGFVHGLGRATPLIFVSILAILGVNTIGRVSKKRLTVDKIMGWALIVVGAFIFMYGLFGMYWWETSPIHQGWNSFVEKYAPKLAETREAGIFFGVEVVPSEIEKYVPYAPWIVMLIFIIIPIFWYRCKKKYKE